MEKQKLTGNLVRVQVQKTPTDLQYRVTIPNSMAKGFDLHKSDVVEWIYAGELLGIRKVKKR